MQNKQKFIGAISMLAGLNLVSLYLAANIHSFLSTGSFYHTYHPLKVIVFVFKTNALKFFGIFLLLSAMFLLHIFWMQKIYEVSNKSIEVTPDIKTPAVAGNGEYGTAKWLPKKQYGDHFSVVEIPSKSQITQWQERSEKNKQTN